MKNDIINRNDIKLLVNAFYDKVKRNNELNYFFTELNPRPLGYESQSFIGL